MVEKTKQDEHNQIIEQGNIYFLYRPKVHGPDEGDQGQQEAKGPGDVQNFYLVLKPKGGKFRLINIGRDRLPDIARHERHWGFVEKVASSGKEIEQELQRDTYGTKTRGERVRPAARPAGEGVYAIVREGRKMHLAWALELPKKPGPVQKAFRIPKEASVAISIKNPDKGSPAGAGLSDEQQARYPKHLQEEFRDRRFATEDPRLFDYEGAEIVLVGARTDPQRAYDIDLQPEDESEASAEIFKELRFAKSRHPVEPLLEGEWR